MLGFVDPVQDQDCPRRKTCWGLPDTPHPRSPACSDLPGGCPEHSDPGSLLALLKLLPPDVHA